MTPTTEKLNAATIWIITKAAEDAARQSGRSLDEIIRERESRLRAIFEEGRNIGIEHGTVSYENPVEINIRLEDIPRATAKWVKICGNDSRRVLAIKHHKPGYDHFNKVYDN